MNFEFLKGLSGLDGIYKPCRDAEELAVSKPYMSMFASRKSAELLAKLIYIAAHYSAVNGMKFVSILRDEEVQRFIGDRRVLQAFHHIRESGNTAVHGNDRDVGKEDAIGILKEMHYVAGETAIRLRLIDSYPAFNREITENPDAVFVDDEEISQRAQKMFLEFVRKQQYQEYSKHFVELDPKNEAHNAFLIHGTVAMHEYLEFSRKPNLHSTVEYIQQYLIFLDEMAWECSPGDPADTVHGSITIRIDDAVAYSGDCNGCMRNDIYEKLTAAQSFSFDCHLYGNLSVVHDLPGSHCEKDAINEDELWQGRGLSDFLESIKRKERFIYKMILYYPDDDNQVVVDCIRNGKSVDVPLLCKADFPHRLNSHEWIGDMLDMYIDLDHHVHCDILEQLHQAVSDLLTEDELSYVQELWDDEEEDPRWLLSGNTMITRDFSEVIKFVDRFNAIVEPIVQECTVYFNRQYEKVKRLKADRETHNPNRAACAQALMDEAAAIDPSVPDLYHCFYCMEAFAVAALIWKDHELQLVGTVL